MNVEGAICLCAETENGLLKNLTSINTDVTDILDLIKASKISQITIDDLALKILDSGNRKIYCTPSLVSRLSL